MKPPFVAQELARVREDLRKYGQQSPEWAEKLRARKAELMVEIAAEIQSLDQQTEPASAAYNYLGIKEYRKLRARRDALRKALEEVMSARAKGVGSGTGRDDSKARNERRQERRLGHA